MKTHQVQQKTERRISAALRLVFVAALLLGQIALAFFLSTELRQRAAIIYTVLELAAFGYAVRIYNRTDGTSYKFGWIFLVLTVPVVGLILYFLWNGDRQQKRLDLKKLPMPEEPEAQQAAHRIQMEKLRRKYPQWERLSVYLGRQGYLLYGDTEAKYLPTGEMFLQDMLEKLEQAEHFIFLEYFIVEEGEMWGQVLSILVEKVKQGVEVRVLVDGTCEFTHLTHDYPRRMQELGIKCKMFAPVRPFVSTHYNYRDHRKIAVVDGQVAFTGGVNLADEYINRVVRFGHWKDTAVMLRGEAVRSFTLMFLNMWAIDEHAMEASRFLAYPTKPVMDAPGFVLPYSDSPVDGNKVGEQVYIDILSRARRYVHIMTPYLIIDHNMETALQYAAERGVDVHLILPGIPDKKYAFALAHTHYASLMKAGVKISEYTPGFVHAKVFVADDREAIVGTINLDYRSLYHHFECAAYMLDVPCIADIEADFQHTLKQCRRMTPERLKNDKLSMKVAGALLKAIAPLM